VTVVGDRAPRSTHMTETDLLRELEPVVEENLERHLKVAKEWMPHEYVPWS
jgi:acyl-[acyl-carrier-protein] desaturase